MLLGQVTDTQDTTGRILAKAQEPDLKLAQEQVETAIAGFLGEYAQIPPMYSALKVKGKKLCDLARAGREVERQARKVQILDISVTKIELPRVWMTVTCSKGTYIRTLCHDIGELKDSLRLDQIEKVRDEGRLTAYILPVEEALSSYPALAAKPEADALLCNGNPLFKNQLDFGKAGGGGEPSEGQMFRIYNSQGQFLGVYQYRQDKSWWKPWKMFLPS